MRASSAEVDVATQIHAGTRTTIWCCTRALSTFLSWAFTQDTDSEDYQADIQLGRKLLDLETMQMSLERYRDRLGIRIRTAHVA